MGPHQKKVKELVQRPRDSKFGRKQQMCEKYEAYIIDFLMIIFCTFQPETN